VPGHDLFSSAEHPKFVTSKTLAHARTGGNRDDCVAFYLGYLRLEITKLSGGAIGRYYLENAGNANTEYLASGSASARYRAWVAIANCAGWLAQLERRDH
jgi:hypothetical protein